MRIISTLFLLFISCISFAQPDLYPGIVREVFDSSKAKNGWSMDCVGHYTYYGSNDLNSVSKALEGRISCLVVPTGKKDTENVVITGNCFGKIIAEKKDTAQSPAGIKMSCQRTLTGNSQPPIMVDGILIPADHMNNIIPDDIDRIEILKSVTAMALFGAVGENGAIVITTKNFGKRKFIIKDGSDSICIPGATVNFSEGNKPSRNSFSADLKGTVIADRSTLDKKNTIIVSAVGYKTYVAALQDLNSQQEIYLERDFIVGTEVIITATHPRRRGCPCCGWHTKQVAKPLIAASPTLPTALSVSFFPNPVMRGQVLNISLKNSDQGNRVVKIKDIKGVILLQQTIHAEKQGEFFQVQTDPRWAAGVYFVSLFYENGSRMASGKITIQ